MSDLLFTVNAVAPIIGMVLVGYFLKKVGLVNKELAKNLNKLIGRIDYDNKLQKELVTK